MFTWNSESDGKEKNQVATFDITIVMSIPIHHVLTPKE